MTRRPLPWNPSADGGSRGWHRSIHKRCLQIHGDGWRQPNGSRVRLWHSRTQTTREELGFPSISNPSLLISSGDRKGNKIEPSALFSLLACNWKWHRWSVTEVHRQSDQRPPRCTPRPAGGSAEIDSTLIRRSEGQPMRTPWRKLHIAKPLSRRMELLHLFPSFSGHWPNSSCCNT